MIGVYYANYKGGINNLIVAIDTATGESSASTKSKKHALAALKRRLSRRQNEISD